MKTMKRIIAVVMVCALLLASTVAFASTTIKTSGKCNLRKGAGLNYSSMKTVPNGTTLTATATKTDNRGVVWYKVKYKGTTGWVSSIYANKGASSAKRVVAKADTYIRSKADKGSKKLGVLYKGEHATYLNQSSKDSRGVRWYKITCDGTTGWVSSKNSSVK